MKTTLEVIYDSNPTEGCGCNCGCGGSNLKEDMNNLIEELKEYEFTPEIHIDTLAISDLEQDSLINKINILLENTNAQFRVDKDSIEEALSNILPLIVLDGTILTAYGIPTLYDVVHEVEKTL